MQRLQRDGQTPHFSNTLFLLDESSMVGLADTAKAMSLIAAGSGPAVYSLIDRDIHGALATIE